ncbi:MAG: hypothetical protein V2A79_13410 [Planctomycetota bacterium]
MVKRDFNGRWLRWVMAAALGGSVFQLGSCDPTVRTTLLAGLATTTTSLATTVIDAYFQSLQDEDTSTQALTTP